MIPKKNRLHSLFFKNLFKKGFTVENQSFSLKYIKENNEDFRIAVVISKKIAPKAVERNLLKRRFLSLVFSHKNLLISQNTYIFYLKKDVKTLSLQQVDTEILNCLQKIYEKNS